MAANDVTVTLAASSTAIKVTKLRTVSKDMVPRVASVTAIAAGGNSVINLAGGDTLIVEAMDHPNPIGKREQVHTVEASDR